MPIPDAVAALVEQLRRARIFDLEQPRFVGAPTAPMHWPGFVYGLHRRHEAGREERRTSASGMLTMADHSGTHIDALCHQAEELRMFGGVVATPEVQTSAGFTRLGVETIDPLLRPGKLLDVAGHAGADRLPDGYGVSAADLEATAAAQGVAVDPGDVVLVRTGNALAWEDPDTYLRGPGVAADGSRWLGGRGAVAVGADNVAWDVLGAVDEELGTLPGHVELTVRRGVYIVENLRLEELAAARAHRFLFVCLPLKLRGVTGSPVRPLAVVPAAAGERP